MKTLLDIGLANAVMAGVLALGAALICRFCRKPALAHALWLLVLLKLIVPPLWKVPVSDSLSRLFPQSSAPPIVHVMVRPAPEMESTIRPMPSAPKAGAPIDAVKPLDSALLAADRTPRYQFGEASTDPHFPSADAAPLIDPPADPIHHSVEIWRPVSAGNPAIQPWRPQLPSMTAAIIGFWLGGSCLCTFIIIARVIRFRRLLAYAVPATHSVQRRADSLARRMGTSSLPTVWFIPGSVCPMLYALGRKPRLLIPEALWNRLNDNQQSSLLVHELAHLRRGASCAKPKSNAAMPGLYGSCRDLRAITPARFWKRWSSYRSSPRTVHEIYVPVPACHCWPAGWVSSIVYEGD